MKREVYYDRCWDWAESTQISRISTRTDFTTSAEVAEITVEFRDEKIAARLVRRALRNGLRFTSAALSLPSPWPQSAIIPEKPPCIFAKRLLGQSENTLRKERFH